MTPDELKKLAEQYEESIEPEVENDTGNDYSCGQIIEAYIAGATKMAELKDAEIKHWKEMYQSTLEQRIRFGVEISRAALTPTQKVDET
jgi:hypothetical protein